MPQAHCHPRHHAPAPSPQRSSVPSGRIGTERDAVFRNNDEFRGALSERELQDVMEVETKLGRK